MDLRLIIKRLSHLRIYQDDMYETTTNQKNTCDWNSSTSQFGITYRGGEKSNIKQESNKIPLKASQAQVGF